MRERLRTAWHHFRRLQREELGVLSLVLLIAGGIWAFVELADEVREGELRKFDEMVLLAFRTAGDSKDPSGPFWIEEAVRDITSLGSPTVLVMVTLAACVYLLLLKKRRMALLLFVTIGGGQLASSLLKIGFDRPRPDLTSHGAEVYTASFPSGHSMVSAVTYLTLGALLARVQPGQALKTYTLSIAVVLTVLIGVSRVYLGVHWPSDVLAGWAAGAAWAISCWLIAWWLQRRRPEERAS